MDANRHQSRIAVALAIVGVGAVTMAVSSKLGWPWRYAWPDLRDDHPLIFLRDRQAPWWPSVLFLGIGLRAIYCARYGLRQTVSISLGRLGALLSALVVVAGASTWAWLVAWNE